MVVAHHQTISFLTVVNRWAVAHQDNSCIQGVTQIRQPVNRNRCNIKLAKFLNRPIIRPNNRLNTRDSTLSHPNNSLCNTATNRMHHRLYLNMANSRPNTGLNTNSDHNNNPNIKAQLVNKTKLNGLARHNSSSR